MGVIERREHLRLAREARDTLRIGREGGRQDFERDLATKFRVARPIDLAHSAFAQLREDFVDAEPGTRCNARHVCREPPFGDAVLSRELPRRILPDWGRSDP